MVIGMAWRRKRGFFDIFDIDKLFRDIEESFRVFEEEIERLMKEAAQRESMGVGPYFYGIRITVGPDGVPRVEEFGNIRKIEGGRKVLSDEIEPLVDVMDADDEIWVVAELPGVDKDKIDIHIKGNKLIIKASNSKKYYKEVELPAEVDPGTAKAKYNNGVLEVTIKKKSSTKKKENGVKIKVE